MKTKSNIFLAVGVLSLIGVSGIALSKPKASEAKPVAAAEASAQDANVTTVSEQAKSAPTHIVELFTSQGCSSCPPANKFVSNIADNDGVLALTYGVTYWDYLGWEDTFGDPSFTKRQREYRKILGTSNIYTPQMVLNGTEHSSRYGEKDIIAAQLPEDAASSYITIKDGKVMVDGEAPKGSTLAIVSYLPGEQVVEVKRGENGGKDLKLTNVVVNVKKMPWKGEAVNTKVNVKNGEAYAALFHSSKTGKIISAANYTP